MKPLPKAYLITHDWNGNKNEVIKQSRADAELYAAKWHGYIQGLFLKEDLEEEPQIRPVKLEEEK
jgi:hypothetical protein